jgi:hypothetical protein
MVASRSLTAPAEDGQGVTDTRRRHRPRVRLPVSLSLFDGRRRPRLVKPPWNNRPRRGPYCRRHFSRLSRSEPEVPSWPGHARGSARRRWWSPSPPRSRPGAPARCRRPPRRPGRPREVGRAPAAGQGRVRRPVTGRFRCTDPAHVQVMTADGPRAHRARRSRIPRVGDASTVRFVPYRCRSPLPGPPMSAPECARIVTGFRLAINARPHLALPPVRRGRGGSASTFPTAKRSGCLSRRTAANVFKLLCRRRWAAAIRRSCQSCSLYERLLSSDPKSSRSY